MPKIRQSGSELNAGHSYAASIIVGVTFGYNIKLESGGVFQVCFRPALAQGFITSKKLKSNGIDFNNALQIYADVDFSGGAGVTRNWGGNFGLSFKF